MIHATYRQPELAEYQGNPLIEALPPILNPSDVFDALTNLPGYDPEERTHPTSLRLHYLDRLLDIVQAQPEHVKIVNTVSRLIRHGYKSRNPLLPAHANLTFQLATQPTTQVRPMPHFAKCRTGMYLTGLSGIGKTTLVERALAMYPQTLVHSKYRDQPFTQTQVVWLKIDCPHDGSQKQLCLNFFSALDAALDGTTNYFEQNVGRRLGVEGFVPAMYRLAHSYHIGFLFLDELQHLTCAPRGGEVKTSNLLVNMMNGIGLPIGLCGTFESASLFSKTFRNARRVAFAGPVVMDRYGKDDPRWRFFIQTLWHYQWTKTAVPLDEDMYSAMYDASQAVTDVAVAIYMITQELAITAGGQETFSANTIRKIVPEFLTFLQPALEALRRGDAIAYEQFRELMPPLEQWRSTLLALDNPAELTTQLEAIVKRQAERLQAMPATTETVVESESDDRSKSTENDGHGLGEPDKTSARPPLPDINAHMLRSTQRNK